jgi:hypothetical protein
VRQFINGTQAAWDDLARRARRACVVFPSSQLPPGCRPDRARIGFEVHGHGAVLFVDKGVRYSGPSQAVSAWLSAGEMRFGGIDDLRNWIRLEIAPLFNSSAGPAASPRAVIPARTPGDLTNLDAVVATISAHAPVQLSHEDLLRELRARVFGQDSAMETLARKAAQHTRRTHPRKPATLFALGPTGVGKTRAAQALAESLGDLLAGRWSSFIRLNMNEYQERSRVSQLLGAPPSYIGYGDGTQLSDMLLAQPESVVLFDEIEKAHPDILVALMSAMDAGELALPARAGTRRAVDCRRAVFFFTANLDATDAIAELDSSGRAQSADTVCRRHLTAGGIKPELVGRIGAFLVFRPLSARARAEIGTAAVTKVAAEYGLHVVGVAPELISMIVNRPYDDLGARPDEYFIDDMLSGEFSRYAAAGEPTTIIISACPEPRCIPAAEGPEP